MSSCIIRFILSVTVVLSGTSSNTNFKGFLVQGRMMADGTAVGRFVVTGNDQRITCSDKVSIKSN